MALTLVRASAMMGELGPVPLGPRLAVECAEHAIIFVSCKKDLFYNELRVAQVTVPYH